MLQRNEFFFYLQTDQLTNTVQIIKLYILLLATTRKRDLFSNKYDAQFKIYNNPPEEY